MYAKCFKRVIDFIMSLCAIIILSPLLIVLAIIGAIEMKGNPFFTQQRPGLYEKTFNLIKFRTMTNEKDSVGKQLPDEDRFVPYGKFLRSSSLDELPELINILKGDMSIVGPRPLLVSYLPFYTETERHRHDVRPGLTGLAQINGRSFITWDEIFSHDIAYVKNVCLINDIYIVLSSVKKVLEHKDIADVHSVVQSEDGQLYVLVNNQRLRLHQPLNVERRDRLAK